MHAAVLEAPTTAPTALIATPVFCPDLPILTKFFEELATFKASTQYWQDAYERDDAPRVLLTETQEAAIRASGGTLARAFAFLEGQEAACYPRNVSMSQFLTYYRDLSYSQPLSH